MNCCKPRWSVSKRCLGRPASSKSRYPRPTPRLVSPAQSVRPAADSKHDRGDQSSGHDILRAQCGRQQVRSFPPLADTPHVSWCTVNPLCWSCFAAYTAHIYAAAAAHIRLLTLHCSEYVDNSKLFILCSAHPFHTSCCTHPTAPALLLP